MAPRPENESSNKKVDLFQTARPYMTPRIPPPMVAVGANLGTYRIESKSANGELAKSFER